MSRLAYSPARGEPRLQSTYDLQSASRDRVESILREVRPRHAA